MTGAGAVLKKKFMIPISLELKGLYSYRDTQFIDFSRLTEASLFGIFGAVGSGKSSILEAITFALYGDTERLNSRGDDRNYHMLNLRSDELWIDFICRAGRDGHRYRFTVRGKRNSKQFRDVKVFDRKAYQWMPDPANPAVEGWMPVSVEDVAERVIGLSYENFKRTIIIPQGRFQEFIDLSEAQRTQMLKDLFSLDKYDLSAKTARLVRRNDLALADLNGKLTTLGEASAESLEAKKSELEAQKAVLTEKTATLDLLRVAETGFEERRKAALALVEATATLETLNAQEPAYAQRAQTLQTYEWTLLHLKPLLNQKTTRREDLQLVTAKQEQFNQMLVSVRDKLKLETDALDTLRPAYQNREALNRQAEALRTVLKLKEVEQSRKAITGSIERGETALAGQEKTIAETKQTREARETEADGLRKTLPDWERLTAVQAWFSQQTNFVQTKESLKTEANGVQAELKALAERRTALLGGEEVARHANGTAPDAPLTEWKITLETAQARLQTEAESLQTEALRLHTQQALHQYANALHPGEACPLCGSEHHPQPLGESGDLAGQLKQVLANQEGLRQTGKRLETVSQTLSELARQGDFFEDQKRKIRQRWDANQQALTEHEARFVWAEFALDGPEAVKTAFAEGKKTQQGLETLEAQIRQLTAEADRLSAERQSKFEEPLQRLRNQLAGKTSEWELLQSQLDDDTRAVASTEVDAEGVQRQIRSLEAQFAAIVKQFEELEKGVRELENSRNTLTGNVISTNDALNQHRLALEKLESQVTATLADSPFATETQAVETLAQPLNVPGERAALNAFQTGLETARQTQRLAQKLVDQAPYDPGAHAELLEKLGTASVELGELTKAVGGLEKELARLQTDWATRQEVLEKKAALDLRKADLDTLEKLFRGGKFVNYVASVYLQNLCNAANERFHRMTRQQLTLEVTENNDFQVRDLLNGGHARILKTLSGGQKFQAALCLALALADNIHALTQSSHNFFFLDEGFGSLDRESLTVVFDTLKSLRKENRIVGVISHVDELQQEIERYLHITNHEEHGSRVRGSWEG